MVRHAFPRPKECAPLATLSMWESVLRSLLQHAPSGTILLEHLAVPSQAFPALMEEFGMETIVSLLSKDNVRQGSTSMVPNASELSPQPAPQDTFSKRLTASPPSPSLAQPDSSSTEHSVFNKVSKSALKVIETMESPASSLPPPLALTDMSEEAITVWLRRSLVGQASTTMG